MPVIDVDFTNVDTLAFLPPGSYRAEVTRIKQVSGRDYPGLKWTFSSVEPETAGMKSDAFLSLAPQTLWKLKLWLEALGRQVPKSVIRLNTDRLIGKVALIKVVNEPWTDAEGKSHDSSKVETIFPAKGEGPTTNAASAVVEASPPDEGDLGFDDDDIPF